jgi:hypothetical protein
MTWRPSLRKAVYLAAIGIAMTGWLLLIAWFAWELI